MGNEVSVNPTPIQRNSKDVAVELLQLHISISSGGVKAEDIEDLYTKYFVLAESLSRRNIHTFAELLPEKLKNIVPR